jgi:hypothetical protein
MTSERQAQQPPCADLQAALEQRAATEPPTARIQDFVWDRRMNVYWHTPTRSKLQAKSVNGMIPRALWRRLPAEGRGRERAVPPADDLATEEHGFPVDASTWWPGRALVIENELIDEWGARRHLGARVFNTYIAPPQLLGGTAAEAAPWTAHAAELFPEVEAREWFLDACAHMVQRPEQKLNGVIVLAGEQGIGKDMLLFGLRKALGDANVAEIEPEHLIGRFNHWVRSILLVINEARSARDDARASLMYEKLKTYGASPPDRIACEMKGLDTMFVPNLMRVVITANRASDLFIPRGDRRVMVLQSPQPKNWRAAWYFTQLAGWYEGGGIAHVAAWLRSRDINRFNPHAEPPRTAAWDGVVQSWGHGDGDVLMEALETLRWPEVVFGADLSRWAHSGEHTEKVHDMMALLKSRRYFLRRMEEAGYLYVPRHNDDEDGGGRGMWSSGSSSGVRFKSATAFLAKAAAGSAGGNQLKVQRALAARANESFVPKEAAGRARDEF